MTCEQAREQFSGWVDQALAAAEREQLEAHLAGCPECAREMDRFARTVALLGRVDRPRAPAGLADRVLAAVRREPWYRRAARFVLGPRPAQVPVSIAASLVIAGLAVYLYQQVPELRQAARREAPLPVERIEPLTPVPLEPGAIERPAGSGPAPPPPSSFRPPAASVPRPSPAPSAPPSGERAPGPARPPSPAPPPITGPGARDATTAPQAAPAGSARPAPEMGATAREERRREPAPAAPEPMAGRRDDAARPSAPLAGPAPAGRSASEAGRESSTGATGAPPGATPAPAPPASMAKERQGALSATSARGGAPRAPDLVGRLAVTDRAAALSALDRLAADVGATPLGRRQEADATIVELMVPRPAYGRLEPGLRAIGAWTRETGPTDLPETILVSVRVVP